MKPFDNLVEISRRRAPPGLLLFDLDEQLLFANPEAQQILPVLRIEPSGKGEQRSGTVGDFSQLFSELREPDGSLLLSGEAPSMVLEDLDGTPYVFRAFPYSHISSEQEATHVMVLVERIVSRHEPDFDVVQEAHGLSRREMDVLRLIYGGKASKAISDILCISEFTVKDHLKKIMQKMKVRSRSELLSLL